MAGAGPESAAAGPGLEWEHVSFVYDGGARVLSVGGNSLLAGYFRPGDVIQAVNGAQVNSPGWMAKLFSGLSLADGVGFDLRRGGKSLYLTVQFRE